MRMQSKRHFVQDFSFTSTVSSAHFAASTQHGADKSFSDLSTVAARHDRRHASSASLGLGGSFNLDSSVFNRVDSTISSSESTEEQEVSAVDVDHIAWSSLRYEDSTLSESSVANRGDTDIFTDVHTRSPASSALRGASSSSDDHNLSDVLGGQSTQSSSSNESVGQLVRRIQAKTGFSTRDSEYSMPSSSGLTLAGLHQTI